MRAQSTQQPPLATQDLGAFPGQQTRLPLGVIPAGRPDAETSLEENPVHYWVLTAESANGAGQGAGGLGTS